MFFILLAILILFVFAFIVFTIFLRKMDLKTFKALCDGKVKRFSKRNKLLVVEKLNILNYQREKVEIDHVIFGKKYIYIITDFILRGFVKGETNDNSWVYYNTNKKSYDYINNLYKLCDQNIRDFSEILGINTDPIVAICLVPNECDFSIKQLENDKRMIVHYSSLNKRIKEFEKHDIGTLNQKQIYEQFKSIKERNN